MIVDGSHSLVIFAGGHLAGIMIIINLLRPGWGVDEIATFLQISVLLTTTYLLMLESRAVR